VAALALRGSPSAVNPNVEAASVEAAAVSTERRSII
jgi:hypothetical protein